MWVATAAIIAAAVKCMRVRPQKVAASRYEHGWGDLQAGLECGLHCIVRLTVSINKLPGLHENFSGERVPVSSLIVLNNRL